MDYNQGGFYRFSNYVYWLLILNFLFVITNILLFAAFILLIPSISNAILYYIAIIPSGPAFAALLHSLSVLARNNEVAPVEEFFKAYKTNFWDVLKVWLPIITGFFILIIDIQYFNQNPTVLYQILNGIFLVILFVMVIFAFYALVITTHYKFRLRDIYRLSLYYFFTWIKRTTGNMGILFLTIVLMFFTSDFIILFISSLVAWLLILNTKPIIQDIKTSFVKDGSGQDDSIHN
ncbi:YesL family protein [Gracilibacillus sp. D59]|uniref:YesL family protein n=1 Tax=Gracilibacillus sp. D59 TaxID=3457434 RepID=UPI003FCE1F35